MFLCIRLNIIYSSRRRDLERLWLGGHAVTTRISHWLMCTIRIGQVHISTQYSTMLLAFNSQCSLLQIPLWDPAPPSGDHRLIPPESQAEIEVTTAISNLSNTVIAATASRSLAKSVRQLCHCGQSTLTQLVG